MRSLDDDQPLVSKCLKVRDVLGLST